MIKESKKIKDFRKGFDVFYESNIKPFLEETEAHRTRELKKFWVALFVVIAATILIVVCKDYLQIAFNKLGISVEPLTTIFAVLSPFALWFIVHPIVVFEGLKSKKAIFELAQYFDGFSYKKRRKIPMAVIEKSHLFTTKKHDLYVYHSDDYFRGVYNDVEIIASEEEIAHKKNVTSNFEGVFVMFKLKQEFSGRTVAKKDMGVFNNFFKLCNYENIKLDSKEFEKEWEVYSTNKKEAKTLLTDELLNALFNIKKVYNSNQIQFSFFEDVLLVAIEIKKDAFETTTFFKNTCSKTSIYKTFEQFLAVLSVADIINKKTKKKTSK